MQPISEEWQLKIGGETYIISGEEKEAILRAGEARFVKFRDLIINPAFVQSMKLISTNAPKLPPPPMYIQNNQGEWEEYRSI